MRFLPGIAIFFLLAAAGVSARQNSAESARPAPARAGEDVGKTARPDSRIHLLPGHKMPVFSGIDSAAGKIWQPGGLTIDAQFGRGFGNRAAAIDQSQGLWREQQTIKGQRVGCAFTRSNDHIVSFVSARLARGSARIRDQKDLAEVRLTALRFDEEHGHVADPRAMAAPAK
jgi:hypothetical protein